MGITFRFKESSLNSGLDRMMERAGAEVLKYCQTQAPIIRGYMQENRPWNDDTTAAKHRLNTSVSQPNENTVRITLAHGVKYGIWLEMAHEKNYAIVAPTIRKFAPEILEDLRERGIMVSISGGAKLE